MCTTGYMHGRVVANLGCSSCEDDCFVHENNRHVHVQCGVVVMDSRLYAACDVYASARQITYLY